MILGDLYTVNRFYCVHPFALSRTGQMPFSFLGVHSKTALLHKVHGIFISCRTLCKNPVLLCTLLKLFRLLPSRTA